MIRTVCFVTGSRAEYGLVEPVLDLVDIDPGLAMQLAVTGTHLSNEHGYTKRYIKYPSSCDVEMLLSTDTGVGIAKSVAIGVAGFADAFYRLKPDIVFVWGDRFEMLSAAQAALFLGIPIAHMSGGEITKGSIDESIRHAITKMAHIHFVSSLQAAKRVQAMGERNIYRVGHPQIKNIWFLDPKECVLEWAFNLADENIVVLLHPVTNGQEDSKGLVLAVTNSLLKYIPGKDEFGCSVIIIRPNSDKWNSFIDRSLQHFAGAYDEDRVSYYKSLSHREYLSLLNQANVLIGNSSSGLFEAPSLGCAVVNVGDRQLGRECADTVLHCEANTDDCYAALLKALSPEHQIKVKGSAKANQGNAFKPSVIVDTLKNIDLFDITRKSFKDG